MLSDAQIATLADVDHWTRRSGLDRSEGTGNVGYRKRTIAKLIETGHLRLTDNGDPARYDDGRYRLHLASKGHEALRDAVARRLVVVDWMDRAEAEGALF